MKRTERIEYQVNLICARGPSRRKLAWVRWWDTGARQVGMVAMDWSGVHGSAYRPAREPLLLGNKNVIPFGNVIPPRPDAAPGSGYSLRSYRFLCHDHLVDADRFWMFLEAARSDAATEVDISRLE